jgi:uncharacterized repeat protein (TIGR01451 family)
MNPTDLSPIASPKQNAGFFRYVVALLLISVAAFLSFSTLGCFSCNDSGSNDSNSTTSIMTSKKNMANPAPVTANVQTLSAQLAYRPGGKINLALRGAWDGAGNGRMNWSPPLGVETVEFPGLQPEPGGPPYVFTNVTLAQATAGIPVAYTVPPPITNENGVVETSFDDDLGVFGPNSIEYQVSSTSHNYASSQSGSAVIQLAGPAGLPVRASSAGPFPVWSVQRYMDISAHLDQAVCQDMVTQGKSANAFMAWRVPVADQIVPNQSYPMPLISSGAFHPLITLYYGSGSLEMPLEVRFAATKWANANLPAAPGEMWLALGLDPNATITCPVMNTDSYSFLSDLSFDLSGRPQACENCVLPAYSCYKTGSAAEAAVLGAALDLLGSDVPRAALAGNTTCLGPAETTLVDGDTSNWLFEAFDTFLNLKPSDPIEIHYWIQNNSSSAQVFNFSTTSNLPGVTWTIYPGKSSNPWEPDLDHPLTGTSVNVPGSGWFHFYIRGVTPVGASAAQYSYAMTVTGTSAVPTSWKGSTILNVSSTGQLPEPDPPVAAVKLSGAATPSPAHPNQDLTYTLTVNNSGALKLTSLVVTDTLPANTTYVSCSGADNCSLTDNTVTWNLASLDAWLTRSMILVVRVNGGLPAGTLLSNTAYSVTTGQGVSASGTAVTTSVDPYRIYLPIIKK